MQQIDEVKALGRLMALCSRGEHCKQELREKMSRWKLDNVVQERIIERLEADGFINEERFCRAFVNDKIEFNHWGQRKIEQALYQKRIDKRTINATLNAVNNERYIQQLTPLIKNRIRQLPTDMPEYEQRQRLIRFAIGRGFSFEVIKAVLAATLNVDSKEIDIDDDLLLSDNIE